VLGRRDGDTGTGYGPPTYLRELTEVGPGTPLGELLRRSWHPTGLSSDAGATPTAVRVLGEDLVLFRDGRGRPALVVARCAHRGTTLYDGRVEAHGVRCCYHGWPFDTEGHCLEHAVRARGRHPAGADTAALVPGAGALRADLRSKAISRRRLPDGRLFHRVSEAVLPTLRVITKPRVAGTARCRQLPRSLKTPELTI
jgi:nitrite reductase/ring-hydroxylating ferredoxin subunit